MLRVLGSSLHDVQVNEREPTFARGHGSIAMHEAQFFIGFVVHRDYLKLYDRRDIVLRQQNRNSYCGLSLNPNHRAEA